MAFFDINLPNEILLMIISNIPLYNIRKYKPYLTNKNWLYFFGNANILIDLYRVNYWTVLNILKITKFVPTQKTGSKISILENKKFIELLYNTYHPKLWKFIRKPTLDDILSWNHKKKYIIYQKNKTNKDNIIYKNMAINFQPVIDTKNQHFFLYNLCHNKIELHFDKESFNSICNYYKVSYDDQFIIWLLKIK